MPRDGHGSSGAVAIWFLDGVAVASAAAIATVSTTWSILATGDFNSDGKADIVWRDTTGNVAVWLMNGTAVLQTGGLGLVPAIWSIAETGDFNGDGKSDLLWRDTSGNVRLGSSMGAPSRQRQASPQSARTGPSRT
jgi:hypothetical protein